MKEVSRMEATAGFVLVGTHPWTRSTFDRLGPRALLPVADRPLFAYALEWLADAGIPNAAVCGNRETTTVQAQIAANTPAKMSVTYLEDPMPRGAAGSVRDAAAASSANTFVVTDGTAIPNGINLKELLAHHADSGAAVTIVAYQEKRSNGNPSIEVPTGIYVFNRRALEHVPERGFCDIKEKLIPQLYAAGERIVTYTSGYDTPRVLDLATYHAVNEWMIERLAAGAERDGYVRAGQALVHRTARVDQSAMLVGPVLVGPGARVFGGAVIVGPTAIGARAIVERGAFVSRSIILGRAAIGEQSAADRCILAADAALDAGLRATQTVLMTPRVRSAAVPAVPTRTDALDTPLLELGRRVGRLLTGGDWSRSTAQ
jgi:mannose-1-phosphate guanylyltransferase/phosphomannomutase